MKKIPPTAAGSHNPALPDTAWNRTDWDSFVQRLYRQREFVIKLGLAPIREALSREGHPERRHRRILVAGTNGKGEACAFLSSILKAHGLRVGFFSSPHILDIRERFRVDGRLMSRAEVLELGNHVLDRYGNVASEGPALTFFESVTLMAALGFAARQVDVAVYEVGLGGRLDATNALEPDLSVITAIGLDHTDFLGDTIESVAGEKAGIFRPVCPAVIGRQAYPKARARLGELAPAGAQFFGKDFDVDEDGNIELMTETGPQVVPWDSEVAPTRRWNAACAVAAAAQFLGDVFDPELARQGLERSRWPGRLDARSIRAPGESLAYDYLFDAAHNPDAAAMLFAHIKRRKIPVGAIICTSMRNKDVAKTYAHIPADIPVFTALLEGERAAGADQLAAALAGKMPLGAGSPAEMLSRARAEIDRRRGGRWTGEGPGVILVFGSIYLLGECFKSLGIAADSLLSDVGQAGRAG